MTMRCVDVARTDPEREFQLARSKPGHPTPQPRASSARSRTGLDGLIDVLLAAQRVMETYRRSLPHREARRRLFRLSVRLNRILGEIERLPVT